MEENYPSLTQRLQSTFIDTLFIIVMMLVFSMVLDNFERVPDWLRISLFAGLFLAYEPLCTAYGFTVGNYLKGIRVRQNDNPNKKIGVFHAFLRYMIKIALGWISFFTIHTNPQKRTAHDLAVGSVMIKL